MGSVDDSLIRPLERCDDDGVVDAIVASSLFEPGDAEMLRSLLAAHHAGDGVEGQRWLVCVGDGQISATAVYRPIEATDRAWDLTMLAVRRDRQGAGAGRQLMSHVEQELSGEHQRILVVQTSGLVTFAPSRAFYQRLGYAERGCVPDYWAAGDDMVLFSKALEASSVGLL